MYALVYYSVSSKTVATLFISYFLASRAGPIKSNLKEFYNLIVNFEDQDIVSNNYYWPFSRYATGKEMETHLWMKKKYFMKLIFLRYLSSDLLKCNQIKISVARILRRYITLKNYIWHMDGAFRLTSKVMMAENPKYKYFPRCHYTSLSNTLDNSSRIQGHNWRFNSENSFILKWPMSYSFKIWMLDAPHPTWRM